MVVLLFTGLGLIFLGLLIRTGKFNMLIAGYNTASKEKRREYDKKGIGKIVGNGLVAGGSVFAVGWLLSLVVGESEIIIKGVSGLFFITIAFTLYYANK